MARRVAGQGGTATAAEVSRGRARAFRLPHVRTAAFASLLLALSGCPSASEPEPTPTPAPPAVTVAPQPNATVTAALEALVAEERLPGLAVGVARGDTVVYLQGFGHEDVANDVPVDPSATLFRWASLSKGLAGVVAAQGAAAGTVDLDVSAEIVDGYTVPGFVLPQGCSNSDCAAPLDAADRAISLRQLLHHTSGVQHYSNGATNPVPPSSATGDPATNTGIAWALDYWKDAPLVHVPGSTYDYSTFGYNLAGVVLETALDGRFEELVQRSISAPLDITSLQPDFQWVDLPRRAVGYELDGQAIVVDGDTDVSWKLPGGGFVSTSEDLTRYCSGLLTHALMDEAIRDDVLWTPAPGTNYGLGFGVGSFDGEPRIAHTGAQQKTRTALWWLPERDLCFSVMTNATWASPSDIAEAAARAWLESE